MGGRGAEKSSGNPGTAGQAAGAARARGQTRAGGVESLRTVASMIQRGFSKSIVGIRFDLTCEPGGRALFESRRLGMDR